MTTAPASSAPAPPPTILVVDDDPELREMIAELLDGAGLEVLTADSGAQALELAAARQPHLVLMDVSMAGPSGPETVRRLRASPATRAIQVVAMTGSTDATEMMADGCVDYIPKPFHADDFPRLVRGLL